ncbi:hypothetical protein IW148_004273 [Coemansia sp. RSA 1199]|nr:hypothetical protein IW148_004273 [Coemansia sp. RSA 1199]
METPAGGAANNSEGLRALSSASASEERRKRRRLNVTDELAHSRVESILREQLDLELYMKQKEVNTISTRLRHSEALLEVLESAIQSQQHSVPNSDDIADGFLSYFHSLGYSSHGLHEQLDWQQLAATGRAGGGFRERPRRAAAAPARYAEDYYNGNYVQSANDDGDDDSDTPIHSDKSSSRRASTRTQGLGTLATRLDAEQMSSVTDALDYISKHRQAVVGVNAESSAGESDSDSWNDDATSKHRAQLKGVPVLLQPARESRFHIIRRVMLGNTSQFFDLQGRPPGNERSTHKWTLYIRSAAAEEHLGSYIRKARVFLHPSYRPDDIVDLIPPKFELTRWGWGEFPVRIQIFFRDKRNKPVDLVHILKLDDLCSGDELLGSETPIDLELDRRGFTDNGNAESNDSADKHSSKYAASIFCNTCGVLVQYEHPQLAARDSTLSAVYCTQECESESKTTHSTATSIDKMLAALPAGWDVSEDETGAEAIVTIDEDSNSTLHSAIASATHAKLSHVAASLRRYHLEQQNVRNLLDEENIDCKTMDIDEAGTALTENASDNLLGGEADDEAIDWIWSIVRPLELNCATASRLAITNSGALDARFNNQNAETQVRLPNGTDEALGEALDQRLVVGRLLLDVTKLFLRDLVAASDQTMRGNRVARLAESHTAKDRAAKDHGTDHNGLQQLLMLTPLHVFAAVKRDPQTFDVCSNAYLASDN